MESRNLLFWGVEPSLAVLNFNPGSMLRDHSGAQETIRGSLIEPESNICNENILPNTNTNSTFCTIALAPGI